MMEQKKYLGEKDLKTVDSKGNKIIVRNVPHYKIRNHIIVDPMDVCYADLLQHAEEMVFTLKELKKIRYQEEMRERPCRTKERSER